MDRGMDGLMNAWVDGQIDGWCFSYMADSR